MWKTWHVLALIAIVSVLMACSGHARVPEQGPEVPIGPANPSGLRDGHVDHTPASHGNWDGH